MGRSLLALLVFAGGCRELCEEEEAAVEIEISIGAVDADQLRVSVAVDGIFQAKDHSIDVVDPIESVHVELEPPPAEEFDVEAVIEAIGADGKTIETARRRQSAQPNACNRLRVILGERADGGVDAGQPDGGETDGAVDAGDTGVDGGVDGGMEGDAGQFPYDPSNFDPSALTPSAAVVLDCAAPAFDSATLAFAPWCGPQPIVTSMPNAVILASAGLTVAAGTRLSVTGDRPVIFAVYGDAQIAGTIDAGGKGIVPGPGGSIGAQCTSGMGSSGDGGGGGGFGSAGGGAGATLGGAIEGNAELVPLRGGCGGGEGGGDSTAIGGGGGGGIQISASGELSITGTITSGGGGGSGGDRRSGGGGGGSGGAILVEAQSISLSATGNITAAGAGGGGGGSDDSGAPPGSPGNDAISRPALGGPGASIDGGPGGNGAFGSLAGAGLPGTGGGGHGGGGGGVGRIRLFGLGCTIDGRIVPAPSNACP